MIIGEEIHTAIKSARNAIVEGGVNFLQDLAKNPKGKMARYIDANVSTERGGKFDIESTEWAVEKFER